MTNEQKEKRPYVTTSLQRLGSLASLTASGSANGSENSMMSGPNFMA